ncbi:MAG: hypothetical protein NTW86_17110 [Candidatus Sumerlaeota bacterium]|nr:hypothetical protein [Candidatus Sumerlaeota bacterium]
MSTILEALSKASREQRLPRQAAHTALGGIHMFDAPIAETRFRQSKRQRLQQWFWIGFGGAAGAVIIAAAAAMTLLPAPEARSVSETSNAAVATPVETATALVIPPNVEPAAEGLPHPFAERAAVIAAAAALPVISPKQPVYLPDETPIPARPSSALAKPLPPVEKPWESEDSSSDGRSRKPSAEARAKPLAPAPAPFVLGGIIWDEADPMALVNRECVRPGQHVGKAEVLAITHTTVTLKVDGREIVLRN